MSRRARKKPVLSLSSISSILLIFSNVALVFGYKRTYEGDEMYVEYNGKTVRLFCDSFKFRGRGYGFLDEYSVCVTPLYFNDSDCAVDIHIKTSFTGVTKHKITCSENKNAQYCGPQDETLYIEFDNGFGRDTNKASFKLKITAKKEYDHNETDGSYSTAASGIGILGAFVGIVITLVWAAIGCCWVCRQKQSQRRVFNPTQLYPSTAIPYVIYSAQTQQIMMTTSYNISSPGVNTMTSYPPPLGDASPRTTDDKILDPTPSYDSLTESTTSHVNDTI